MKYEIGQYSKPLFSIDNAKFLTLHPITDVATKGYYIQDLNPEMTANGLYFANPYIQFTFNPNQSYFMHVHIQPLDSRQDFSITLMNYNEHEPDKIEEQIVESLFVPGHGGSEVYKNKWYNYEFSFQPLKEYHYLVFKLTRTTEDYNGRVIEIPGEENQRYSVPRIPVVQILEFSNVNNIFKGDEALVPLNDDQTIIKLGVHANPGFNMYINDSEIMVGKSGIYELQNQLIFIDKFSVMAPFVINNESNLKTYETNITNLYDSDILKPINKTPLEAMTRLGFVATSGRIEQHFPDGTGGLDFSKYTTDFINTDNRAIPGFTMDYVIRTDDGVED